MKRRSLIAAALALVASAETRANQNSIELVYVGARECLHCKRRFTTFVRSRTGDSPFARAFFTLVEELGVVEPPAAA